MLLLDEPLAALDARTRASGGARAGGVLRDVAVPALLVTHDFAEAAQLGDRVGVIDGGRVVQEGSPSELAAAPRSAFVADFTGAVVLTGDARRGPDGLTLVGLDGGGTGGQHRRRRRAGGGQRLPVGDRDRAARRAAARSARNHLAAEVTRVTDARQPRAARPGAPQPLAAAIAAELDAGRPRQGARPAAREPRHRHLEGRRHTAALPV